MGKDNVPLKSAKELAKDKEIAAQVDKDWGIKKGK